MPNSAYPVKLQGLTNDSDGPTRREERIPYATRLTYTSDQGLVLHGYTTDVSLSGAYLHLEKYPDGVTVGDRGMVAVTLQRDGQQYEMSFACTVARINQLGMGLYFDDSDEE